MLDSGEMMRKLALHAVRFSGLASLMRRLDAAAGAILMLHKVTAGPQGPLGVNSHLAVTPTFLDSVLVEIARLGYRFVSMDEALDRLASRAGEPFVVVTADDGYRDNLTEALPVLERHGAPLTLYIAPGLIDGTVSLWWDVLEELVTRCPSIRMPHPDGDRRLDCATPAAKIAAARRIRDHLVASLAEEDQNGYIRALARAHGLHTAPPRGTLLSWEEIGRMACFPTVTIGAHSVHHYNLKRLSNEQVAAELEDASNVIMARVGQRPRHLAYPYGHREAVGRREVAMARAAGYASAVTTRHGLLRAGHAAHPHALPRLSVNGRYQEVAHIRTMLSGVTTPLANRGRRLVTV